MKFGLMCFNHTTNLGNEIQSIAARRFLPKIDHYIDHERLHRFSGDNDVKMIMNGWYLDCSRAWPPTENINPLLVSMHFTTSEKWGRRDAVISEKSKEFFEKNGSVGCRDYHTVDFLTENDIKAHFTGCLTLTLDSGTEDRQKGDYIIINSEISNDVYRFLKEKTDRQIYVVYQDMFPSFEKAYPKTMPDYLYNFTSFYDCDEKFFMAENLLKVYENASCVVTDRLHCALPCLAFETPVLLLNSSRGMRERYNGLNHLLNQCSFEEYQNDYNSFDVENPPENPKDYLKIRKDLIKTCEKFTGHINKSCYTKGNELVGNVELLSRNAVETRNYFKNVLREMKSQKNTIAKQKKEIKKLKAKISQQEKITDEMKSSKSWKITSPMRNLKNRLK